MILGDKKADRANLSLLAKKHQLYIQMRLNRLQKLVIVVSSVDLQVIATSPKIHLFHQLVQVGHLVHM